MLYSIEGGQSAVWSVAFSGGLEFNQWFRAQKSTFDKGMPKWKELKRINQQWDFQHVIWNLL